MQLSFVRSDIILVCLLRAKLPEIRNVDIPNSGAVVDGGRVDGDRVDSAGVGYTVRPI